MATYIMVDFYEVMKQSHWDPLFCEQSRNLANRLMMAQFSQTNIPADSWFTAQLQRLLESQKNQWETDPRILNLKSLTANLLTEFGLRLNFPDKTDQPDSIPMDSNYNSSNRKNSVTYQVCIPIDEYCSKMHNLALYSDFDCLLNPNQGLLPIHLQPSSVPSMSIGSPKLLHVQLPNILYSPNIQSLISVRNFPISENSNNEFGPMTGLNPLITNRSYPNHLDIINNYPQMTMTSQCLTNFNLPNMFASNSSNIAKLLQPIQTTPLQALNNYIVVEKCSDLIPPIYPSLFNQTVKNVTPNLGLGAINYLNGSNIPELGTFNVLDRINQTNALNCLALSNSFDTKPCPKLLPLIGKNLQPWTNSQLEWATLPQLVQKRLTEYEHHFIPIHPDLKTFCKLQILCVRDEAKTRFFCVPCQKQWTSMKGSIIFTVILSFYSTGLLRIGSWTLKPGANVFFEIFPQACGNCDVLCQPKWYSEEISKVIRNLFVEIHRCFYHPRIGWDSEWDHRRRDGNPGGSHNPRKCAACRSGLCRGIYNQPAIETPTSKDVKQSQLEFNIDNCLIASKSETSPTRSPPCKRRATNDQV